MPKKTYREIVESFSGTTVAIIGDMILDVYILGKPARLSREAPVVVVEFEQEDLRPGGAANAVYNISSLGAKAVAIGILGDDTHGRQLGEMLAANGADTGGLFVQETQSTITKTRVLAGDIHTVKQQVLRVDRGKQKEYGARMVQSVLDYMSHVSPDVDCWLVSDYGYDLLCQEIENNLADAARRVPVVADSRYNVKEFPRITAVTPNEGEALSFGKYYLKDETDLLVIGQQMLDILYLKCALITRGNEGMIVFQHDRKPVTIPVVGPADIVDVSGAGDTVATTFGLALACGAEPEQAARLANCAASVVVMKSGTATCSGEELLEAVEKYL